MVKVGMSGVGVLFQLFIDTYLLLEFIYLTIDPKAISKMLGFNAIFNTISVISRRSCSFTDGGNWKTRRKQPTLGR